MSNSIKTFSVKRETISLGDIKLEVLQLPNGDYKLSQTQVAEAVGKKENDVRQFLTSKSPQALPYKDFTPVKGKVDGERIIVNLIPLDLSSAYWLKETLKGNVLAGATLVALAQDSLTRMADCAFGVVRPEEEYSAKVKEIRQFGKDSRRKIAEAVEDYIAANNLTGNKAKFLLATATNETYKALFGKDSKQLVLDRGKGNARDGLSLIELDDLSKVENTAANLINAFNIEPIDAVKRAAKKIQLMRVEIK